LLFDHDRNIGSNLAGDGLRGRWKLAEAELSRVRNLTRSSAPIPVVRLDFPERTPGRSGMRFYVVRSALDVNGAARRVCFDAAPGRRLGIVPASALMRTSPFVSETLTLPEAVEMRTSSPRHLQRRNPGRGSWRIAIDLSTRWSGGGLHFYGAAHSTNRLRTGATVALTSVS